MAKSHSVWRRLSAAVALGAGLTGAMAEARELVWTGESGQSPNWNNRECVILDTFCFQRNWNGGTALNGREDYPIFQDTLIFRDNGARRDSNNNIIDLSVKKIILEPNADSHTISGNKFFLTGDLDDNGSVGIHKFGHSSTLTVENDIQLSVASEVDFRNDGVLILDGVISGKGLAKTAGGTLQLNEVNTYTGRTNIRAGTILLGETGTDNSIESSREVVLSGNAVLETSEGEEGFRVDDINVQTVKSLSATDGTIKLGRLSNLIVNSNHLGTRTFAGDITGEGDFTKTGDGTLALTGSNSNTGDTRINIGTLRVGASDVLAETSLISMSGGRLEFATGVSDSAGSLHGTGSVVLNSGSAVGFGGDNRNAIFSGIISGAGNFEKIGTGQQSLRGNNTYTGSTSVRAGILRLDNDDVLADASAVSVEEGGTLILSSNRSDTVASLSGTGDVTVEVGGTLAVGADGTDTTFSGKINGDGRLSKIGVGALTLAGNNTHTGNISIEEGDLRLANERLTDSLALTVNGGTFDLQGFNQTIASLSGNGGAVHLGSGGRLTLDDDGDGSNYAGIISGQGTVVYNGDQGITLFGKSTFTGTLDVQRGTVALINGGNLADGLNVTLSSSSSKLLLGSNAEDTIGSLSGRGRIQLGPDSTLTVGGFGPGVPVRTVFSGHMFGEGGFTQTGFKLIELTGQNTYTGDTTVDNGNIQISNNDVIADSSDVVIKGGSLRLSRGFSDTVGSLSGGGGNVYVEDGAELSVGANNTSTTYGGSVRGDGALVKTGSGTMTLDGGGTLSVDELAVAGGQVRLNGTGALEMSSIKVNSGTSLNLLGRTRVDRVSAALVNDGFVFARLSGTIFDGDVSGSGDFGGRTIFNGSYGPGNSPALVQHQTTQFTSNHTLYMELGGLNRGSEYDAIDAFSVTLSGLLDVSLIDLNNGFSPMAGDTFDLIIANQIIGNFSSFSFAALADGLFWTTQLISSGSQMIYQLVVDGQLNTGVPGPGTIFILLVGLVGVVVIRHGHRSKLL